MKVRRRPPARRSIPYQSKATPISSSLRQMRAVRLKDKVETVGDVVGVSHIERRPRNGNVAD
jgi:hypothetical protein